MTKKRRLIALCLAAALCLGLFACGNKDPQQTTGAEGNTTAPEGTTYTVTVKSEGGKALANIGVYVYADAALEELVTFVKTDDSGTATFTDAASDSYVAVLVDVPEGYEVWEKYAITGETTEIVLSAGLLEETDLAGVTYKLGDVMHDFSVTTADGTVYKLSELLAQKKAVVLNFWYIECDPCKAEFPYLQEAYTEYSDVVEVIAMNPVNTDAADIADYQTEQALTFPMVQCDAAWEDALQLTAYPTTVVVDQYGTIALIHKGSIPDAQTFKDVFAYFSAEDYEQTVVEDIADIMTTEPETGTVNNPTELGGVTSFELTVEPGKVHYVDLYKVTDMWMQINNSDIYVEYNGKTYEASGDSVGLMVTCPDTYTPAKLGFGNSGKKAQTFTVTLSNLQGSLNNPYSLQLGEFTATVAAGNDQGVYFTYTAAEDGTFTMQCLSATSGVEYDYTLYNTSTYAMRTLKEDAETDANGNTTVSVTMKKGQEVQFSIGTLPTSSNTYPAGTFKLLASFSAGEVEDVVVVEKIGYAITVTDENRKPVAGVNFRISGSETSTTMATNEEGIASVWLPKGDYTAVLVLPSGYTATTAQFELTEKVPTLAVKLDTIVDNTQTYTVRVVDNTGAAVPNALVTIDKKYGHTDASGYFTATLDKGSYTAVIGVPNGYSSAATAFSFNGGNYLTITLTKGGSTEQTGTAYTVKVVDAAGNAMTGVVVTYLKNGTPVGVVEVDETGTAVAYLEPGDYTVTLVDANGSSLDYDEEDATLTADKQTTTIAIAADISNENYKSAWWGNYFTVHTGSTNVALDTSLLNLNADYDNSWMYVFEPSLPGVYRLTISDGAVLSYRGSVNFPGSVISSTDVAETYFEVSVRSGEFDNGNQPEYVLGVTSAELESATITITRMGDVTGDLPVEVYTAITAPSAFTLEETGNLSFVQVTGTATLEKRADGYYVNGEKAYLYVGPMAEGVYLSFSDMVSTSAMKGYRYEAGEAVAVIDYTQCMMDVVACADAATAVYPLTDDLITIVQSTSEYMGWCDPTSPGYLFDTVTGTVNEDIAWMFNICYFA